VNDWSQLILPSFLYGCFIGGPATSAYVATSAKKERMAITFTTISASWSLSYTFAPGIGSYLATVVGIRRVFHIAFVLFALATITLLFIRSQRATTHSSESPKPSDSFKPKRMFVWALFFAAIFFTITLFRPCIPQFFRDVHGYEDFHVGIFGSITFFGSFVFAIVLGRVGDKWKKAMTVLIALLLSVASVGLLISFRDFAILAFSSYLMGGSYVTWSLMGATIGSLAPEASRGRWMAVAQTASLVAAFPAPYIGGILYEASPYNPFTAAIIATLSLAVLALVILLKVET